MSVNIQFMETGNLFSPDEGIVNIFCATLYVLCVGRLVCRLSFAGWGVPRACNGDLPSRCCLWPYLER